MSSAAQGRYKVVFTPVGWQAVDTHEARDPVAEFGTGRYEYERADLECAQLNGLDRIEEP